MLECVQIWLITSSRLDPVEERIGHVVAVPMGWAIRPVAARCSTGGRDSGAKVARPLAATHPAGRRRTSGSVR